MSKPHIWVGRCNVVGVDAFWTGKIAHRRAIAKWFRAIHARGCRGWYGNAGKDTPCVTRSG